MKFYPYDDIKRACSCADFAEQHLGLNLNAAGRCAATWRGGDNPTAVHINAEGWFDHVRKKGGSVIDLTAEVKFNGNVFLAQEFCGDALGLATSIQTVDRLPGEAPRNRYERLQDAGYKETARYIYADRDGTPLHQVVRLENPAPPEGKPRKEFVQADPRGTPTVKGISLVLYNLPVIADSTWAIVVEGEKDVETLKKWGLPATCNAGGAEKWLPQYTETLNGKDVVIIADNDEPGQNHARLVAGHLKLHAQSLRIITISALPKGDATDWIEQEQGTQEQFMAAVKAAPELRPEDIEDPDPEAGELKAAKEANRWAYSNYFLVDEETDDGKKKKMQKPRKLPTMIDDCYKRFLGFPRKCGSLMFDHDRNTGEIYLIQNEASLVSWIQRKSKRETDFARGPEFATKRELFEGLHAESLRYEAISHVPDWPRRPDVYYAHGVLPPPTTDHQVFEGFLQFFCPAPGYEAFLRAFVAAPLFFQRSVSRPLWIIDSEDGQESGKTKVATKVADLYGKPPITVGQTEMAYQGAEVMKRLVTSDGRLQRMFLIDNVTGNFKSRELATLLTLPEISARPPYGRTEETRPNNLTAVITSNSAMVDSDLVTRGFYLYMSKPEFNSNWDREVAAYIAQYRFEIFADIIDILEKCDRSQFETRPTTRFPEFEELILQPMCGTFEQYADAIKLLADSRAASNIDEDTAFQVEEAIRSGMVQAGINPETHTCFIQSAALDEWLRAELSPQDLEHTNAVQLVRNLAKINLLPGVDRQTKRYRVTGDRKVSGVLWKGGKTFYEIKKKSAVVVDFIITKQGKSIVKEIAPDKNPVF